MPRRTKDAPGRVTPRGTTGRVTPKGTRPSTARGRAVTSGNPTGTPSGRYTAPIPDEYRSSPWWVPAIMLAFFGLGVLVIVLNYLSLLPASPTNWYLLGGLAAIVAGFVAATRYH
ncbi:MAG TPA: cell division protein CrgA [Acidimicrobiales bacterium]|nr:cell division protein CrgA [Acidimicrobiales bacterium]